MNGRTIRGVLVLVVLAYARIANAEFADVPARVIETKVQLVEKLPDGMGWLDNDNLAITTLGDDKRRDWWIRKLVVFNIKTQEAKVAVSPGFLLCSNPEKNVTSIAKGTLEKSFMGKSNVPDPEPVWFKWDRNRQTLQESAPERPETWNNTLCLPTAPKDVNTPGFALQEISYLQPEHGALRWKYSPQGPQAIVSLVRSNQKAIPLDLRVGELSRGIKYMSFLNTYFLREGWFSLGGVRALLPGTKKMINEIPLTMLDPDSGEIERSFVIPILKDHLPPDSEGTVFPSARGTLIYVQADQDRGGGLYLAGKNSVTRIWCVEPSLSYLNRCRIHAPIAISPNGCRVAFFSDHSTTTTGVTAKILDLCSDA
jgi:hypothetical protein